MYKIEDNPAIWDCIGIEKAYEFLRSWKYLEVFLSISICATTILWTLDRHAPHRAYSWRIPMSSSYTYERVKSLVTRWMMKPFATIRPVLPSMKMAQSLTKHSNINISSLESPSIYARQFLPLNEFFPSS